MKKILILWVILTQALAVFAQNKTGLNDTLSFTYLTNKSGKPIMDSSDCFLIGDPEAAKLLVFPIPSSSADMMDDFLFIENTKTKQHVSYFKCVISKDSSGGARYREIQKTLEANLRIKLKMPDLRIRLVWAPGLSDEDANLNFVEK
jgi:hypothetical protein